MATYKPDRKGTGALMQSPIMQAMVARVARDGIEFAQAISPDAPPYGEGYVDSFEVDGGHVERIARQRRAVAYLYNTSEYAAAVEWGWGTSHAGYHVLSYTADIIEGGF